MLSFYKHCLKVTLVSAYENFAPPCIKLLASDWIIAGLACVLRKKREYFVA